MTQEYFEIRSDINEHYIYIALRGFWSVETVAEYYRAKNAAIDKYIAAGYSIENIKILFDISQWDTQSRKVSEMIDALDDRDVKAAVIAQSAMLPRKQSQRLAGKNYQFFSDKEEALAWLNNDHS